MTASPAPLERKTLTIERLDRRGDGVVAGVRVALSLPGEVVAGEVAAAASPDGRPAAPRIAAPTILAPSPHRAEPPCPRFGACGGCALQHASDAFVARWKADVVRRALAARGLPAEVAGVATSPPASRRRATLCGRRAGGGAVVGFHARRSGEVVGIEPCRVLMPSLLAALPACEAIVAAAAARGDLRLTLTDAPEGVDVAVAGGPPLDRPLVERLTAIARAGLSRLAWDGEVVAQAAPPTQRLGAARVTPPPGAFLQATRHGEAALWSVVRGGVKGAARVADLFAGCGTFALRLAAGAEVHAVEGSTEMLAALDAGARGARGLRRVTTEARDLHRRPLSGDELAPFDAAVMDPPRAGAEGQARALAEAGPPVVVSVSCDPATFARDAAILVEGGYRLGPVRVVDQFRWSAQVEVVSVLSR